MQDTTVQRLITNIRAEMDRQRLSQEKLGRLLSLSQPAVSRRLTGHVPFNVEELDLIANKLNLSLADLINAGPAG